MAQNGAASGGRKVARNPATPPRSAPVRTKPVTGAHTGTHQSAVRAVAWALLSVVAGFIALQLWRPYYFLNDDNVSGWYPVAVGVARRLWSGQNPFISPHIQGGYAILRDPGGLCLWNPFWLAVSPLALTKWRLAMTDVYAGLQLLVCAFSMAHLLLRVREKFQTALTDARIAFLTFSYTFSIWMTVTAPNWLTFIANQAALPILFLGIFHPRRRAGTVLVACAVLHSLLGGHLNSFILSVFFVALWLIIYSVAARADGGEAWRRVFTGAALAGVIASPVLIPAMQGFFAMSRSAGGVGATTGQSAGGAHAFDALLAMPLPVFASSYFIGMFAAFFGSFNLLFVPNGLSSAIVFTPVAYWIFHSIGARRKLAHIEIACLVTAAFVALCVVRPPWLSAVFSHIPLLRSTRIPFREVFAFLFFVHIFIALRPVAFSRPGIMATTAAGVFIYVVSLILFRPPAFTPMPLDRMLLLSGQADVYWAKVRPLIPHGARVVPVIAEDIPVPDRPTVPWTLMNAYNYAALSGIDSRSGYVIRGMTGERLHGVRALGPLGVFLKRDIPRLRAADPKLCFIVLSSREPIRIELWKGTQRIPLPVPPLPRVKANRWDLEPR